MSIEVPVSALEQVAQSYGPAAYVLVNASGGPPRVTHAVVRFEGEDLVARLGRSSHQALVVNPQVCVLWAATGAESMSLIADGVVSGVVDPEEGGDVTVTLNHAVRHRSAPAVG